MPNLEGTTEDSLTHELEVWCAANGLTPESADEMLCRDDLTEEQRGWLYNFIVRWNALASTKTVNIGEAVPRTKASVLDIRTAWDKGRIQALASRQVALHPGFKLWDDLSHKDREHIIRMADILVGGVSA